MKNLILLFSFLPIFLIGKNSFLFENSNESSNLFIHKKNSTISDDGTALIDEFVGGTVLNDGHKVYIADNKDGPIYFPSDDLLPWAGAWQIGIKVYCWDDNDYYLKITDEPSSPWNPFFDDFLDNKSASIDILSETSYTYSMGIINPDYSDVPSNYVSLSLRTKNLIGYYKIHDSKDILFITDADVPNTSVNVLPTTSDNKSFTVNWSGVDKGANDLNGPSGIQYYDVQYRINEGGWKDWLVGTNKTSETFDGTEGNTYYFQCRAVDNVGNKESFPGGNGDTYTTIKSNELYVSTENITLNFESGSEQSFSISSNVSWTVSDDASWLSVTPTSGSNNGTVTVKANSANTSTSSRSATVTVTGGGITRTLSVKQQGASEHLTLDESSLNLGSTSGSAKTFNVSSNISWSASDNASWLSVSPTSGSDDGTITVEATSENTSTSSRSATVTVTGGGITRNISVSQQGIDEYLDISVVNLEFIGEGSHEVEVSSNIDWSVSEDATWIDVYPISGSNDGTIIIETNSSNTSTSDRSTVVYISGEGLTKEIYVTQVGVAKYLDLSKSSLSFNSGSGNNQSFSVYSNVSWSVNENVSWLNVSPTSGSNSGTVTIETTSANTNSSNRSATITVSGEGLSETITVTQAGQDDYLDVNTSSLTLGSESGNTNSFSISSNLSWSVDESASWLNVSPTSGTNDGTVTVEATSANTNTSDRTTTVTVSGEEITKTIEVKQEGTETSGDVPTVTVESVEMMDPACFGGMGSITIEYDVNANGLGLTDRGLIVENSQGEILFYPDYIEDGILNFTLDLEAGIYYIQGFAENSAGGISSSVMEVELMEPEELTVDAQVGNVTTSSFDLSLNISGGVPPYMVEVYSHQDASSLNTWIDYEPIITFNGLDEATFYELELQVKDAFGCITYTDLEDIITEEGQVTVELDYIKISGDSKIDENSSKNYTCTAYYSDGSTMDVTNSANWSENSTHASINSSGKLTASDVDSDKSVTITAEYEGESDSYSITIEDEDISITSLQISGPNSVDENSTAEYMCLASFSDGSRKDVASLASWEENSSYASINSEGVLTTYSVDSDKPFTLEAHYKGETAKHYITINDVEQEITLNSIEIEGESTMNENDTLNLKCKAFYSDGSSKYVTDEANWTENSPFLVSASKGLIISDFVEKNENAEVKATFEGKEATKILQVIDLMNNYTIKEIQGENESSPYLNQTVSVSGIITAVCPDGYFIQDASEEWCGVYINDQLENDFSIGDGIAVTGIVEENQGNTQINEVSDYSSRDLDIEINEIITSADESLSEKYEGVLVSVHGLRAKELTSSYSYYGEWLLEGENNLEIIVNDMMYKYEPIVGDYYNVTGVVNFSFGKYKLEPRNYSDVVNLTAVNVNELEPGIFEIILYPNPTQGEVNINMELINTPEIEISVMNIAGSEIFRKEYRTTDKIRFDLSNHVSGMYFVKIKTDRGEVVKKLILNRK